MSVLRLFVLSALIVTAVGPAAAQLPTDLSSAEFIVRGAGGTVLDHAVVAFYDPASGELFRDAQGEPARYELHGEDRITGAGIVSVESRELPAAPRVDVYPQPARGGIALGMDVDHAGDAVAEVFDLGGRLLGRTVTNVGIGRQAVTLALPPAAGVYLLRMTLPRGRSVTRPVVSLGGASGAAVLGPGRPSGGAALSDPVIPASKRLSRDVVVRITALDHAMQESTLTVESGGSYSFELDPAPTARVRFIDMTDLRLDAPAGEWTLTDELDGLSKTMSIQPGVNLVSLESPDFLARFVADGFAVERNVFAARMGSPADFHCGALVGGAFSPALPGDEVSDGRWRIPAEAYEEAVATGRVLDMTVAVAPDAFDAARYRSWLADSATPDSVEQRRVAHFARDMCNEEIAGTAYGKRVQRYSFPTRYGVNWGTHSLSSEARDAYRDILPRLFGEYYERTGLVWSFEETELLFLTQSLQLTGGPWMGESTAFFMDYDWDSGVQGEYEMAISTLLDVTYDRAAEIFVDMMSIFAVRTDFPSLDKLYADALDADGTVHEDHREFAAVSGAFGPIPRSEDGINRMPDAGLWGAFVRRTSLYE